MSTIFGRKLPCTRKEMKVVQIHVTFEYIGRNNYNVGVLHVFDFRAVEIRHGSDNQDLEVRPCKFLDF